MSKKKKCDFKWFARDLMFVIVLIVRFSCFQLKLSSFAFHVKALRANGWCKTTPIMLLSSNSTKKQRTKLCFIQLHSSNFPNTIILRYSLCWVSTWNFNFSTKLKRFSLAWLPAKTFNIIYFFLSFFHILFFANIANAWKFIALLIVYAKQCKSKWKP